MARNFAFIIILIYLVVGLLSFITILNHNFKTISRNKELENKILSARLQLKDQELHYLKKQIHPHFLFNTLNTIYGFAMQQSKQTPDIILRLSNLLDYILYRINQPFVPLEEEVAHIREYIELEQIRFKDNLNIQFKSDPIDDSILIAPMILLPFVENAFKHGRIVNGFITIDIELKLLADNLKFIVNNSCHESDESLGKSGIGISNLKKRLELQYQDRFFIEKNIDDKMHSIVLIINGINKNDRCESD